MFAFFSDPAAVPQADDSAAKDDRGIVTTSEKSGERDWPGILVMVMGAGIAAGLVSLVAGELVVNAYHADLLPKLKNIPGPEDTRRLKVAQVASPTITFGLMGGIFGLAMGVAGGWLRRSAAACVRASALGVVAGAIGSAAVAWIVARNFFEIRDQQSTDLLLPLVFHGLMWLTVAAVGGVAVGVGLGGGRVGTAVGGAVAGAVVATLGYELVGAIGFATSKTELPLSASLETRAMAQILVPVFASAGIVFALRGAPRVEKAAGASA